MATVYNDFKGQFLERRLVQVGGGCALPHGQF